MSNVAYYVSVTEYESGWGCRPDGYIVSLSREWLEAKCKEVNSQQGHEFSRVDGKIKLCIVTEDFYKKLTSELKGHAWTGNNKNWLKEE